MPTPEQPSRDRWWAAPVVSCVTTLGLVLPLLPMFGLATMATAGCYGSSDCPEAYFHLDASGVCAAAAFGVALIQWVFASWVPRAVRSLFAGVPPGLMVTAMILLLTTPQSR